MVLTGLFSVRASFILPFDNKTLLFIPSRYNHNISLVVILDLGTLYLWELLHRHTSQSSEVHTSVHFSCSLIQVQKRLNILWGFSGSAFANESCSDHWSVFINQFFLWLLVLVELDILNLFYLFHINSLYFGGFYRVWVWCICIIYYLALSTALWLQRVVLIKKIPV